MALESLFFSSGSSRSGRSGSRTQTKSLQLCRQVQRRLDLALGELDDPVLQGLWVHSVHQDSGGRTLLVEVVSPDHRPVSEILARLDAARAHLRQEIAAAIHRKRTPHLQFMVVPPRGFDPQEDEP